MRRTVITASSMVLLGLGCNALFSIEPPSRSRCGDGVVWNGEACDDGNTESGDGCSSDCVMEHGFTCEGEPSACVSHCGDGLKASDEACDDTNDRDGDGCDSGCAIEDGYACEVDGEPCHTVCGDGLVVGEEVCDDNGLTDGDGCSSSCVEEHGFTCEGAPSVCKSTCGDGKKASDEACDDGNTVGGDGCQADCAAEEPGYICLEDPNDPDHPSDCSLDCGLATEGCEAEPNGILAKANAMGASGYKLAEIDPADDADIFSFMLPAPTVMRAETFDSSRQRCDGLNTTLLLLLDGVDSLLDDDSGIGQCAMLTVPLPSGKHYFKVTGDGVNKMGPYLLGLEALTTTIPELTEPNDMTATPLVGEDIVVTGSIGAAGDVDTFSLSVLEGQSIRAEIIEGQGNAVGACNAGLIQSRLALSQGQTTLVAVNNGGRGECSRIDGFGSPPIHAPAHGLGLGTYTLRVSASSNAPGATFAYRLVVTLR